MGLLAYPTAKHSRSLVVAMEPGLVLRPQVFWPNATRLSALRHDYGITRNRADQRRIRRTGSHERPVVVADPQPDGQDWQSALIRNLRYSLGTAPASMFHLTGS
jgi:hypothetical protein